MVAENFEIYLSQMDKKLPSINPIDDIDPILQSDDADFLIGSNPLGIASDDPRAAEYIIGLNDVNDTSKSDCDSDNQE